MKGYVFLSNSNKPNKEEQISREQVILTNLCKPSLEIALAKGYKVWLGVNRYNPNNLPCELPINMYDSHTYRSVLDIKSNFTAYKNLMKILKNEEIEVIHCNTPIGGMIGRICGKKGKVRKVIYTVHGFHFYKGAPLINRTIFKWAEMFLAKWTDTIITMNQEDYEAAKKLTLRKDGRVYQIPGVGIDTNIFREVKVDRDRVRSSLGLKPADIVCISMGDLIPRKNYGVAINAISKCNNKNIKYIICGQGKELELLRKYAKEKNVADQIFFLGHRNDIKELLKSSDIFLFTSLQEGLPRSLMEAMATGLPCIVSKIRGNVDLLEEGKGGYLVPMNEVNSFVNKLQLLASNEILRRQMGENNLLRIMDFDTIKVKEIINKIYTEELK